MNSNLILNNISIAYGEKIIIDNINTEFKKGQLSIIIGPNGAGKSTLLHAIGGDIKPIQGSIKYAGENITKLSVRTRAHYIAIVDTINNIEKINIEDYIILGRAPHRSLFSITDSKEDIKKAQDSMRMMHIEHLKGKKLNEISSGEQQLVAITKAIVQETPILILDEPTSNLDLSNQKKVMDIIAEITQNKQLTTIIVVHDINLAISYADKIIIINNKKIEAEGNADKIITQELINKVYGVEIEVLNTGKNGEKAIIVKR